LLVYVAEGRQVDRERVLEDVFKAVAADAGVEGRSCHSLKHTRASLMVARGAQLSEIRQQLGHKSLYVHSTDAQAGIAARKVEANVF
jgi:integrase